MKPEITEALARAVVSQREAITEWFKDPAVAARYEAWLAEKRAKDEEVIK